MEKSKVIEVLHRNEEPQKQYNELLQLFMKHPHHGPALAKYYNASGFSKTNLETLRYDIKQTYDIADKEVREFVAEEKAEEKKVAEAPKLTEAEISEKLSVDLDSLDYNKELKPLATEISNALGHEIPNYKKETLQNYLKDQKAKILDVSAEEVENAYESATEEAKEGLKLRQEFPFLSE